jgi:glycosyltransferase involved in cell wall biosynthesis
MVLKAIESALIQDGCRPEVVAVDDGSTDGTERAVRKYFPEVRLITTPGLGPGLARNEGARIATGDVFMFLDSDDKWLPLHIKSLMSVIQKGFHVAYGVTRTKNLLDDSDFFIPEKGEGASGQCFSSLARWCFLVPSSVAVTRKAFENVGGFDSEYSGEDWVFFLKLASLYPFGFVKEVITHRILHKGSLCCLERHNVKIQDTLRRITRVLKMSDKALPEDFNRIKKMQILTAARRQEWQTIQDWYISMKKQGLI